MNIFRLDAVVHNNNPIPGVRKITVQYHPGQKKIMRPLPSLLKRKTGYGGEGLSPQLHWRHR
jgi:hypothetical protein